MNDDLAAVTDTAPTLVCVIDRSERIVFANDALCDLAGAERRDLIGRHALTLLPKREHARAIRTLQRLWDGDPVSKSVFHFARANGKGREPRVVWEIRTLRCPEGNITHSIALGVDVTGGRPEREPDAQNLFEAAFRSAPTGIAVLAADGNSFGEIRAVNEPFTELAGAAEDELVGKAFHSLAADNSLSPTRQPLRQWLDRSTGEPFQLTFHLQRMDGRRPARVRARLSRVSDGGEPLLVCHLEPVDMPAASSATERVLTELDVDPDFLSEQLDGEAAFLRDLQHALPSSGTIGVVRMYLLGTEDIQAVHGCRAADEVIEIVADSLRGFLPAGARLARTGRGLFAACIPTGDRRKLLRKLNRVSSCLDSRARIPHPINPIAGVSFSDTGQMNTAEILYTAAGFALAEALRTRQPVVHATAGKAHVEQARKRLSWQQRLRAHEEQPTLRLYGQPIERFDGTDRLTELSVRALDENGRIVSPSVFLPVAENTGLITDIDRWLLRQAMRRLSESTDICVVRVSPATLSIGQAFSEYLALLETQNVDRLVLAVTTNAPSGVSRVMRAVERLHEAGVQLMLTHFGYSNATLYCALNHPFSYLKLHGSFVEDITTNEIDLTAVEMFADMCRRMNMTSVAEHVENEEIAHVLKQAGVQYGVGFYFGEPAPL